MSSSSSCSDIDDSENPVWGKYLKNRVCYKELPGVINDKLLKELLQKQMEGDETGKLLLENGINYEKVTELRLEFCKILRLDHLWMMSNLKILKMNNNFIEKIENLDELTALTDLDLSFNKIVVIENLDKLVNLEKLSLFENSISEIVNMENLKNLTIFSIGGNEISDLKNVIYLRKLPKLRSLNMAGNPCCNEKDFRYFLATYLPNLEYYEYRAITKIERQIGDEMFHDEYALMLEKEKLEKTSQYKHEIEEHDAQVNAESFVEYLNTRRLFESFFENDAEGSALLLIGADAKKLYVTYEENIVGICRDLFRMGQTQHEIRQENLKEFENSVKVIQNQNQTEAIGFMEHFLEEKSIIVEDLKDIRCEMNRKNVQEPRTLWERVKDLSKNFEELSNSLWKDLMKLESVLFEQMMELNETYENTLSDLITSFIEQAQGMFVTMRDVVAEYNDSIQEIAQMYYATVVLEEEEAEKDRLEAERKKKELEREALKSGKTKTSKSLIPYDLEQETKDGTEEAAEIKEIEPPRNRIPEELKPHVKDRETLMNALAGSRDIHLLMVDNREDLLVSKARDWQQDVIRMLYQNEVKRNREKVLEINHFLNVQNDEFHLLSDELENNLKIIVSAEELG